MIVRTITTDLNDDHQIRLYEIIIESFVKGGQRLSFRELESAVEYETYKKFYQEHRQQFSPAMTAVLDRMLINDPNNKLHHMFIHLHKLIAQFNRYTNHVIADYQFITQEQHHNRKEFDKNDKHYIRHYIKKTPINAFNLGMLTDNAVHRLVYINIPHSFPLGVKQ
jgi:hypothetical protein